MRFVFSDTFFFQTVHCMDNIHISESKPAKFLMRYVLNILVLNLLTPLYIIAKAVSFFKKFG